jgi:lysozyme family protein
LKYAEVAVYNVQSTAFFMGCMEASVASTDFSRAEAVVLVYEGGKVDDPHDPGGRTNEGVTQTTYNAYRRSKGLPLQDVYLMPADERDAIYKREFWDRISGDTLPTGLDLVVYDGAVNSGVAQSIKWLQASLGSSYAGQIDGMIGAKTLQAIEDHGDVDELIEEFCARRLGTLKRLNTWPRYGVGWAARISNGQKIAMAWADATGSTPEAHPVDVMPAGGHQKAHVNDNIKQPFVSQVAAHTVTVASGAGAYAAQASTGLQGIQGLTDTFASAKYVLMGLAGVSFLAGLAVKIATDANTAAIAGTAKASVDPDADAAFAAVPTPAAAPKAA